jgi:hypothetical protein
LGTPNTFFVSASSPLDGVPFSGVPRDKLVSELTDEEIGQYCDFVECLAANGRGRACYHFGEAQYFGGDKFQLETVPMLAVLGQAVVHTCYPTPWNEGMLPPGGNDITLGSRESCTNILRNYEGGCHVGPHEDCMRMWDVSVGMLGSSEWPYSTDACQTSKRECGVD